VAASKLLAFISAKNWLLGSAYLKTLDNKPWAVFEDMACQKRHKSLESLRRSLVKTSAEIPLEIARGDSSGQRLTRLALRHRAVFLRDIIVNENLKLFANK
jgi:hypothetical protein